MADKVAVLGANGRFGRAAVLAFAAAGWQVRAATRSGTHAFGESVEGMAVDGFDPVSVTGAAAGCDVIVNAFNPPYPRWTDDVPRLTRAVIAAARTTGATVIIPGNVYNYGAGMPARLTETTPQEPTARKGRLRVEMEAAFRAATADGVRAIVLRGGDFIERERTGNWFDSYMTAKLAKGRVMYPGPLDVIHAWAYLPDMVRAAVGLAARRAGFAPFEEFGFAGFNVTGGELVAAMERAAGRPLKVGGMPWPVVRLLGLVNPQMREIAEMAYLWRTPHAIDGAKLASVLPEFTPTPLDQAIADAIGAARGSAPAGVVGMVAA